MDEKVGTAAFLQISDDKREEVFVMPAVIW